MSYMHGIATRTAARVQEERLPFLMSIQDHIEIAMTEHDASSHEAMWFVAGNALKPLQQRRCDGRSAKIDHELVIVDGQELAGLVDSARHVEGSDDLSLGIGFRILLLFSEGEIGDRWRLHGGDSGS